MNGAIEPQGGAATPEGFERKVRREHTGIRPKTEALDTNTEVLLLSSWCVVVGPAAPTENPKGGETGAEAFRLAAEARGGTDHG